MKLCFVPVRHTTPEWYFYCRPGYTAPRSWPGKGVDINTKTTAEHVVRWLREELT